MGYTWKGKPSWNRLIWGDKKLNWRALPICHSNRTSGTLYLKLNMQNWLEEIHNSPTRLVGKRGVFWYLSFPSFSYLTPFNKLICTIMFYDIYWIPSLVNFNSQFYSLFYMPQQKHEHFAFLCSSNITLLYQYLLFYCNFKCSVYCQAK